MSDWRKKLQPASFRGVPFMVDGDSSPIGRDVVIHEYASRDKPKVEDMGAKTRIFRFPAFVVGDTCLDQRDALLKAINEKGQGELVHPWFGRMKATATGDCTVSHSRTEGGVVRFELAFVEGGDLGFPVAKVNTAQKVQTSAESLKTSALSRFSEAMAAVNMAKVKVNAIQSSISSVYGTVSNNLRAVTSVFASARGMMDSIMNAPSNLAGMVFSAFGEVGNSFSGFGASSSSIASSGAAVTELAAVSVSGGVDAQNLQTAVVTLMQDAAVYSALLDVAQVPIPQPLEPVASVPDLESQAATVVTAVPPPVAEDILAARDAITEPMFQLAITSPLDHFHVVEEARRAVHQHLSAVARAGVKLKVVVPVDTQPALVLAYRLYADAKRADEIVARNRLRHAGFVPAVELQVARS